VADGRGWCISSEDPSAPALSPDQGRMGVRLWLAHEFRREWKSGRRAALRHTSKVGLASRLAQHKSEVLHYARTQRLLRGPRYPSAIWGPALFIGPSAAERLPEIDMPPCPCQYPPVTGPASPRHGALQMQHQTSAFVARHGHTANGGEALTEIATISTLLRTFIRLTHPHQPHIPSRCLQQSERTPYPTRR
jgi:hypothetical protein